MTFKSLLLLTLLAQAHGWGWLGHTMIANIAWKLLPPTSRASIESILIYNTTDADCLDCSPLGYVASWADDMRYEPGWEWTAGLHYMDVHDADVSGGCPVGTNNHNCQVVYERDCVDQQCVAAAIVNYTEQVFADYSWTTTDLEQDDAAVLRSNAIKFVTHFVGDSHQPLHVGRHSDLGGNDIDVYFEVDGGPQVESDSSAWNLHAIWDDALIERIMDTQFGGSRVKMEDSLLRACMTSGPPVRSSCARGDRLQCTLAWAQESFDLALHYAYVNADGSAVTEDQWLTDAYYKRNIPVVKERLMLAGMRLAATLQEALAVDI